MRTQIQSVVIPPLLFLAAVAATALLVNPIGDFPLHDDWVHMAEVEKLLDQGHYVGQDFLTSTLVAQAYWGAAFCWAFGTSYTALRFSTLVLLWLGMCGAYACSREVGLCRARSFLVAGLLLVNPMILPLSFTFMTDVPFMVMVIWSGWGFLRSLRTQATVDIAAGFVFAILAFLVRQHGIVLVGAYLGAVALCMFSPTLRPCRRVLMVSALGAAVFALIAAWWLMGGEANSEQSAWGNRMGDLLSPYKIGLYLRYALAVLIHVGLFALPITVMRIASSAAFSRREKVSWGALFLLGLVCAYLFKTRLPMGHDVLHDLGAGWRTLTNDVSRSTSVSPIQLGKLWWLPTIAGVGGAALWLVDEVRWWSLLRQKDLSKTERPQVVQRVFLLVWAGLFVASFMPFLPRTADRYMLPALLPLFLLFMLCAPAQVSRGGRVVGAATLLGLYLFSLACTQDYLSWNRARYAAISRLVHDYGADPLAIDGGFEYNGVHTRELYREKHHLRDYKKAGDRGWWLLDDAYAVSFFPRKGFETLEEAPYFTWLGMTTRTILILKRGGDV